MTLLLRLTHSAVSAEKHRLEVALEGPGVPRHTSTSEFSFGLDKRDRESIRWYLEDYLKHPVDPGPTIAKRVERRMEEIGKTLFTAIFQSNEASRELWLTARSHLSDCRIEIASAARESAAVPWELLRDPRTNAPVALRARSFVRAHPQAVQIPRVNVVSGDTVRILLAICRPGRERDVPFRSVASKLLESLSFVGARKVEIHVSRPATYAQFAKVLHRAADEQKPFHIVHFDGHGEYRGESSDESRGYILFERPDARSNKEYVNGHELGKLLVETAVSVLVLNACRSAHAESGESFAGPEADGDEAVLAYGSFALEVMHAGVPSVVAMRYNVYVVTAVRFVRELYTSLVMGRTVGDAVSDARRHLDADPYRTIAYDAIPLRDWCVPVVFEAAPISLFPTLDTPSLSIDPTGGPASAFRIPRTPDVGFIGRDDVILDVDRSFDTGELVLLFGLAGAGKTATAAEFARWYSMTGAVSGPVLFTLFEQRRTLSDVLAQFGAELSDVLSNAGVQWLTLTPELQRSICLQVLKKIPVLWIWDNVESVAGMPIGTESHWSPGEQQELADFLRDVRGTKAKILLTSRRDEKEWLGDLPTRVRIRPMPMQERTSLAKALMEKKGLRFTDLKDWQPILEFSAGNPLTLTVLVKQAVAMHVRTAGEVTAFIEGVREGRVVGGEKEEESGERSASLRASLSYGFDRVFRDPMDVKRIGILHLFQQFVDVGLLNYMGSPENPNSLAELHGWTVKEIHSLLTRATQIGLLEETPVGWVIHPAMPWFLEAVFEQNWGADRVEATRAYVAAVAEKSNYCAVQYDSGNMAVLGPLEALEPNLLRARYLALKNEWWPLLSKSIHGIRKLYAYTGRETEWARLLTEVIPCFIDLTTDQPLPGREYFWTFMTDYRVRLQLEARRLDEAERLQRLCVAWDESAAATALAKDLPHRDLQEQHAVKILGTSLKLLGDILREAMKADSISVYKRAAEVHRGNGDLFGEAEALFNLGHAQVGTDDLEGAEESYDRAARLWDTFRPSCIAAIANVRYELYRAQKATLDQEVVTALRGGETSADLAERVEANTRTHLEALSKIEPQFLEAIALQWDGHVDQGPMHNGLASVYSEMHSIYGRYLALVRSLANDTVPQSEFDPILTMLDRSREAALHHYQEGIRHLDRIGASYQAGLARLNTAELLSESGNEDDALAFAHAAARDLARYGGTAQVEIARINALIARITAGA